jgi:outer membrane biosynthesis protein TonB
MPEDNAPENTQETSPETPTPEVTVEAAAEVVETAAAEVVEAANTVTTQVSESTTAAKTTVPSASEPSTLNSVLALLNKAWKFSLPWLLLGSISALRLLVSALNKGLASLETSAPKAASKAPSADTVWQKAEPFWQKFWPLWQKFLGFLRGVAPANWRQTLGELSDKALSWIIIGFLLLFLWFWSIITPDTKPAPKMAARPPAPTRTVSQAPKPMPTTKPSPVKVTPTPKAVSTPAPPAAPVVAAAPKPAPVVTPAAQPRLSKEQTLLADIRTALKKSSPDAEGLIQDLKLNLPDSRLQVQLQSDWYQLSPPQQDKLAQALWQGSNRFDFEKFELVDPQNRLVARSPLIGTEMIVLRRSLG